MGRTWTNKQRHDKNHRENCKKIRESKKSKRHTDVNDKEYSHSRNVNKSFADE